MNKNSIKRGLHNAVEAGKKHSPVILTAIGIGGFTTTTVLAIKATTKAEMLIAEAEAQKGADLTKKETFVAAYKPFIPVAITWGMSTACIIAATAKQHRRHAKLISAYNATQTAFATYKNVVKEEVTDKKMKTIEDEVAKRKLDEYPVPNGNIVALPGSTYLCMDYLTGKYFRANEEQIDDAFKRLSLLIDSNGSADLNDLFELIDPRIESVPAGETYVWDRDTIINAYGMNSTAPIHISARRTDGHASNGEPAYVMGYSIMPEVVRNW